ncbi:MAG: hypothetical protein WAZ27_02855 [Minisyncoccia bacterium]
MLNQFLHVCHHGYITNLPLKKDFLLQAYINQKKSAKDIAKLYDCSEHKVNYWLGKYKIPKRSISEAIYIKSNPGGDPFSFRSPSSREKIFLYGLGMGLYWGEGTKKNKHAVRLGNSDPSLVKAFMQFLVHCYGIPEKKFRFWLQVFSDMPPEVTVRFWCRSLGVSRSQFGKVTVTPRRGVGTYREKTKYGVVSVYVANVKLRNLLCLHLEKLQKKSMLNTLSQKPM